MTVHSCDTGRCSVMEALVTTVVVVVVGAPLLVVLQANVLLVVRHASMPTCSKSNSPKIESKQA